MTNPLRFGGAVIFYVMGLEFNIIDNAPLVDAALPEAIEKALEAMGLQAEGYAKVELSNTPKRIDTGLLRNSITHAVSGKPPAVKSYHADAGSARNGEGKRVKATGKNAGIVKVGFYSGQASDEPEGQKAVWVGTNVEYATYVHDGTSKMAANRFLRNAIVQNKDVLKAIAESELKNG